MSLLINLAIRTSRVVDLANERIGRAVAWLNLLVVLIIFAVVVARYAFNAGWVALQESAVYFYCFVFLFGAGYTLKRDDHVRVDIFYQKLSARGRAWINILGTVFLLFPFIGFILWASWDYVMASWDIHESSREAGGLPWVYLWKTAILAMAILVALQGLAELLRNLVFVVQGARSTEAEQGADHRPEV